MTGVQTCALPICAVLRLRIALACLHAHDSDATRGTLESILEKFPAAVAVNRDLPTARFEAAGYVVLNGIAVRIDAAERLAAAAATLARQGPFVATPALSRSAGISLPLLTAALAGLGFAAAAKPADAGGETAFVRSKRAQGRTRGRAKPRADSPFAALAGLVREP